jgi:hypothetical protein
LFSYGQPFISSAIATNAPRSGSASLTVIGGSFGAASYSQMINVGSTSVESSQWSSVSAILGKSAMGSGARLPLTVSLAIRRNLLTAAVSYDLAVPLITDRLLPSTGHEFVVAYGTVYGGTSLNQIIRIGKSTSESSVWVSDSTIVSLNSWLSEPALACGFCIWYVISLTRSLIHDPQYLVRIV